MMTNSNQNGNEGLTSREANERLKKFGKNIFSLPERNGFLKLFLHSLCEPLVIALLVSATASFIVAVLAKISADAQVSVWQNFLNPILIIAVVIINIVLTVINELKSQKSIGLLKKMDTIKISVKRDGRIIEIDSSDVVVDDIIVLREGCKIPADAVLLEANDLFANESALTGESYSIEKFVSSDAVSGQNLLFAGCFVVKGSGIARVVATGFNTRVGKIHQLVASQKRPKSNLQIRLAKLSKYVSYISVVLFLLMFGLQIIIQRDHLFLVESWIDVLLAATVFAISVIPEGIAIGVNIILFTGITRMAKQNAIVKKLDAIESISRVNVICTDKTGTLTKNQMEISQLWTPQKNSSQVYREDFYDLITNSILCTDAHLVVENEAIKEEIGDPTETALLRFGWQNHIKKPALLDKFPCVKTIPFNSETKSMTTIHQLDQDHYLMIVKGAPEQILVRCASQDDIESAQKVNEAWSSASFRVLAIATKIIVIDPQQTHVQWKEIKGLQLVGLLGLIDPIRKESYQAVNFCQSLGIKVCMITGDNLLTAKAIATDLKILQDHDLAITGDDLDQLNDTQLVQNITNFSVYARVKPQDKLRIVRAWQKQNQIVAMTGDGVNDAPALKGSDIGFAMGIGGTDVAKEASSIVLMDDNFSTIANSIQLGKAISQRIRWMMEIVLTFSFSSLLIVLVGMGLIALLYGDKGNANIFNYIQLLWLNLLAHGFLSVVVGFQEVKERDLAHLSPRVSAPLFWYLLFWKSFLFSFFTIISYVIARSVFKLNTDATAVAFGTFAMAIAFNPINVANNGSIFKCDFSFHKLIYIALIAVVAVTIILLFVPGFSDAFGFSDTLKNWRVILIGLVFGLGPTLFEELRKIFFPKTR